MRLFVASRVPRVLVAVLAGSGTTVAGAVMQMSVHNRLVSLTTADMTQFTVVGLLPVALLAPSTSVLVKMLVVSACMVAGSAVFLRLLWLLSHRRTSDDVTVPLIGPMPGGVVGAGTTFVAWRHDLLQSLGSWTAGNLPRVLVGCYELLWLVALIVPLLYLTADRLTVASLGAETATGFGLSYHRIINLTIMVVAVMMAVSVVMVGSLPFLRLVVPNIVSRLMGDDLCRSFPVAAVGGAVLTLRCDVVGCVVRYPYKVPPFVVMGVIDAGVLTVLILRGVERG